MKTGWLAIASWLLTASAAMALIDKPIDPGTQPQITYCYPVMTAVRLMQEPTIDGRVDTAEWAMAAQPMPSVGLDGMAISDSARYWLAYSQDALLIAFRFERPPGAPQPATGLGSPWKHDSIEVFLRPEFGTRREYTFVMDAAGQREEGIRAISTDRQWTCPWTGAARIVGSAWEGEMRIPFSSLNQTPPEAGKTWEMVLVRNQKTPAGEVGLSGYLKHWTAAEDFGYLRFGAADGPAIRAARMGTLNPQEVGATIEVAAGSAAMKAQVEIELYRMTNRQSSYYKLLHEAANPLGVQAANQERERIDVARVVKTVQGQMEPVKTWRRVLEPAAGTVAAFPVSVEAGTGDYVLHYQVTDTSNYELLAGGALPFSQLPALHVELQPYLLMGKSLVIQADYRRVAGMGKDATVIAELREAGTAAVLEQAAAPVNLGTWKTSLRLPAADRLGKTYDVSVQVLGSDRKVLAQQKFPGYALPAAPAWWNNSIGKVEALGRVPKPWTPIEAKSSGFAVWGRSVELDGRLMPRQITHEQVPMTGQPIQPQAMLAQAASLDLEAEGGLQFGSVETLEAKPWLLSRRVPIQGPGIRGSLRLDVEFDGFMKYTLALEPAGNPEATVSRLQFRVPLQAQAATHFSHGYLGTEEGLKLVTTHKWGAVPPEGLQIPFTEKLWVGSDTVGLAYAAEWDRWWSPIGNRQAVQLVRSDSQTTLQVNMVSQPRTITGPVEYQWAILPTPAQPMNQKLNHELYLCQGAWSYDITRESLKPDFDEHIKAIREKQTDSLILWPFMQPEYLWNGEDFACPGINPASPRAELKKKLLRQAVDRTHSMGIQRVVLYAMWAMPTYWPGLEMFWREMVNHPLDPAVGQYHFYADAAFTDWYVYTLKQTIRDLDVDGIYEDSTNRSKFDVNPVLGTAWTDDAGKTHGKYVVFGNRELHKRIWVLFHEEMNKPHALLYMHNSGPHSPMEESFADIHHGGEGSVLNQDAFIALMYGYPFGKAVTITRWNVPYYPNTRMESWATALMLDIDIKVTEGILVNSFNTGRNYDKKTMPAKYLWAAWQRYPWEESIFLPPWRVAPLVRLSHPKLLASLHYNKSKAAMVAVASFEAQDLETQVMLDFAALGLDPAKVKATDIVLGEEIPCDSQGFTLKVLDHRWRAVYLEPRQESSK